MRSQQETHSWQNRRRPSLFTCITGLAGWHDVVRHVAATLAQRYHMILRKALRWLATVGAAIPVGRLDRAPLISGKGSGKSLLAGTATLGFCNPFLRVLASIRIALGHAFGFMCPIISLRIEPSLFSLFWCSPQFLLPRSPQPLRRGRSGISALGDCATHGTMSFRILSLPLLGTLDRNLPVVKVVILAVAGATHATAEMRLRLAAAYADLRNWHPAYIVMQRVNNG